VGLLDGFQALQVAAVLLRAARAANSRGALSSGREGGLFTITIAEEDRPRRSHTNRPLPSCGDCTQSGEGRKDVYSKI